MASSKEINKKLQNSVFSAKCIIDREREYISLSPALNNIMGGLLGGSFCIITGGFKTGKSATAIDIAKRCQKHGYKILYADIEHRLNERDLRSTADLDLSEDKFEVMRSSAGNILTGEDFISMIRAKMATEEKLLVIADSVSMLCPKDLIDGDVSDKFRDSTPALLSRFSKVLAPVLGITNNIFIGITHIIANTSGIGMKTKMEASGNKIQYAMDFKLEALYSKAWTTNDKEDDKNVVGQNIFWKCANSILVPKGREATGKLRFGTPTSPAGIDALSEMIPLLKTYQIITAPAGSSWITVKDQKIQGEENLYNFLQENPELQQELYDRLRMFIECK